MYSNKPKDIKTESTEQALARGVKIVMCPPIPSKGQRETVRSYNKRVNQAKKIDMEHIPDDIKRLVATIE